jgi:hypothetical protein
MTFLKKAVYRSSCVLVAALIVGGVSPIRAQYPEGLDGTWQGVITMGVNTLRVVLEVSKSRGGIYLGTLVSLDQGGARIPIDRIDGDGNKVRFEARAVKGSFEGTMNAGMTKISGTWTQVQPLPLGFERTSEAGKREFAADTPKRASYPFGVPLVLNVPFAPVPFAGGGKTQLCYELQITNWGAGEVLLSRIDVIDNEAELASFEGSELNVLLTRPGAPGLQDKRAVGPGLQAVAFLWISVENGAATPRSLRHRITSGSHTVEGSEVPVVTAAELTLGPRCGARSGLQATAPRTTPFTAARCCPWKAKRESRSALRSIG